MAIPAMHFELNVRTAGSQEEKRLILAVSVQDKFLRYFVKESAVSTISFQEVLAVIRNIRKPESFTIYFKNGKPAMDHEVESQRDRDSLCELLSRVCAGDLTVAEYAFPKPPVLLSGSVKKQGKLTKGDRFAALYPGRLVLYRTQSVSTHGGAPLNVIFLADTKASSLSTTEIKIKCRGRKYEITLPTPGDHSKWLHALDKAIGDANKRQVLPARFRKRRGGPASPRTAVNVVKPATVAAASTASSSTAAAAAAVVQKGSPRTVAPAAVTGGASTPAHPQQNLSGDLTEVPSEQPPPPPPMDAPPGPPSQQPRGSVMGSNNFAIRRVTDVSDVSSLPESSESLPRSASVIVVGPAPATLLSAADIIRAPPPPALPPVQAAAPTVAEPAGASVDQDYDSEYASDDDDDDTGPPPPPPPEEQFQREQSQSSAATMAAIALLNQAVATPAASQPVSAARGSMINTTIAPAPAAIVLGSSVTAPTSAALGGTRVSIDGSAASPAAAAAAAAVPAVVAIGAPTVVAAPAVNASSVSPRLFSDIDSASAADPSHSRDVSMISSSVWSSANSSNILSSGPLSLTVVIKGEEAEPLGMLEIADVATTSLAALRLQIDEELDNVPEDYAFLWNNVPIGKRQEEKKMLSSHPRDQPITIRRSKDRATTNAAEEADAKTPVLPIIPEAPPVVIPTAPPVADAAPVLNEPSRSSSLRPSTTGAGDTHGSAADTLTVPAGASNKRQISLDEELAVKARSLRDIKKSAPPVAQKAPTGGPAMGMLASLSQALFRRRAIMNQSSAADDQDARIGSVSIQPESVVSRRDSNHWDSDSDDD